MKKGLILGVVIGIVLIALIAGYVIFLDKNKHIQSTYICSDGTEVSNANECLSKGGVIQQGTPTNQYGDVYGNVPTINQTAAPEKHASVNITSTNIQTREGDFSHTTYRTIVGEVKNNGERTANGVKVIATLYDANNQIVGTEYAYAEISDLKISQVSPFKIADIETTFQTYKLQVDWSEWNE